MSEPRRILYVEDEPDIRTIAEIALEVVGGFTVTSFANGHDAVAGAARVQPDLLLLDVMMPGMDGLSTLQALRQVPETATTPVIFMTAKVQAAEINSYKAAGALDVIAKPFDPMALPGVIRSIWARGHAVA
ncbi:response regulator [Ramlibacter sp. XY19]|uniref:response regulator n=1 Tax=Ramlibacter paludis TaxID=2908000 RepID=UPI0023DC982E|nr:response regulator [Ramlibacter paludis]MCG2591871.1 response regulator [Ramlibacter paludis]